MIFFKIQKSGYNNSTESTLSFTVLVFLFFYQPTEKLQLCFNNRFVHLVSQYFFKSLLTKY